MSLVNGELSVYPTTAGELDELELLYREACGYLKFDLEHPLVPPSVCVTEGELPEGGDPANYTLMTIRVTDTVIGYIGVYRDYPERDHIRIPFLYIGKNARSHGFGQKAVALLCRFYGQATYKRAIVRVSLRNWGALRFFNRLGFDRVTGLVAPGEQSEGAFGCVELSKTL